MLFDNIEKEVVAKKKRGQEKRGKINRENTEGKRQKGKQSLLFAPNTIFSKEAISNSSVIEWELLAGCFSLWTEESSSSKYRIAAILCERTKEVLCLTQNVTQFQVLSTAASLAVNLHHLMLDLGILTVDRHHRWAIGTPLYILSLVKYLLFFMLLFCFSFFMFLNRCKKKKMDPESFSTFVLE